MLTPSTVHGGLVEEVVAARQIGLDAAYAAHPERFVAVAARPPTEVWINRPTGQAAALQAPQPDAVAEASGLADPSPPTSQRK